MTSNELLIAAGVLCILAGLVGGGFEIGTIRMPQIINPARQVLLCLFGAAILITGLVLSNVSLVERVWNELHPKPCVDCNKPAPELPAEPEAQAAARRPIAPKRPERTPPAEHPHEAPAAPPVDVPPAKVEATAPPPEVPLSKETFLVTISVAGKIESQTKIADAANFAREHRAKSIKIIGYDATFDLPVGGGNRDSNAMRWADLTKAALVERDVASVPVFVSGKGGVRAPDAKKNRAAVIEVLY